MATDGQGTWFDYFKENMEDLGYTVPTTWLGTSAAILAIANSVVSAVEKYGPRVRVVELIGAGLLSEQLMIIGACYASGLAGAMVGSAAVATGRTLGRGTRIADAFAYATVNKLNTPTVRRVLIENSRIYDRDHPVRSFHARTAR